MRPRPWPRSASLHLIRSHDHAPQPLPSCPPALPIMPPSPSHAAGAAGSQALGGPGVAEQPRPIPLRVLQLSNDRETSRQLNGWEGRGSGSTEALKEAGSSTSRVALCGHWKTESCSHPCPHLFHGSCPVGLARAEHAVHLRSAFPTPPVQGQCRGLGHIPGPHHQVWPGAMLQEAEGEESPFPPARPREQWASPSPSAGGRQQDGRPQVRRHQAPEASGAAG